MENWKVISEILLQWHKRKIFFASNCDWRSEILICQICNYKKRGHGADKCRFCDPQSSWPVNVVQANVVTCQLCSKLGHNAKTCRLNNNVNFIANKNPVVCQ